MERDDKNYACHRLMEFLEEIWKSSYCFPLKISETIWLQYLYSKHFIKIHWNLLQFRSPDGSTVWCKIKCGSLKSFRGNVATLFNKLFLRSPNYGDSNAKWDNKLDSLHFCESFHWTTRAFALKPQLQHEAITFTTNLTTYQDLQLTSWTGLLQEYKL